MMKKLCVVLLVVLLGLLGVCVFLQRQSTPDDQPKIYYYKAEFMLDGEVLSQQQIEKGNCPQSPDVDLPGLIFAGWLDAAGKPVDVGSVKISADTVFYAKVYPQLKVHTPFLFADENNFLRPNDALTANELTKALGAVATDVAKEFLVELPQGETAVTPQQLVKVLSQVFPAEKVNAAMGQVGTAVNRRQFAAVMCRLLGCDEEEIVKVAESQLAPIDVPTEMAEYAALMEASIPHTEEFAGVTWESLKLTTGLKPGFFNLDGWLYYAQESGYILADGKVGTLKFGPDGRYTCGDAELDATVAEVLDQIIDQNPGLERLDILRKAYEYTRDSFTYLRKDPYLMGATGWEIADAKKMFQSKRGNCYYFAGAFWALAQGLGYEAEAVSGTCTGTHQPHAWVIIAFDGEDFFFDPQWENNYYTREMYDMDMFMLPMDEIWYWTYDWVH